jgi:hypothetical protein
MRPYRRAGVPDEPAIAEPVLAFQTKDVDAAVHSTPDFAAKVVGDVAVIGLCDLLPVRLAMLDDSPPA